MPEALETGEYKVGGTAEFDDLEPVNVIAYSGDKVPLLPYSNASISIPSGGFSVNGIENSISLIITKSSKNYQDNPPYIVLMNALLQENFSDFIVSCFTVPYLAVKDFLIPANIMPGSQGFEVYLLSNPNDYLQSVTTKTLVSTPSNLDGYTPRNQKLRTYPYLYLGYNPVNGSSKVYRYEDFTNGTPVFDIYSEVNPNPSIYFVPKNYRGALNNSMSDIVSLNGYPLLSSKVDTFNTWLAQNSQILSIQAEHEENQYNMNQMGNLINGSLALAGNIATGNVGGALASAGNTIMQGLSTQENHEYFIKNQMAQIEKQKMLPDKVTLGGSNATLLGYGLMDTNIFTRYTIKAQFAERIDKYFDMYGYLTNKLKLPNLNNRPKWNYIKTVGANILGNIPQIDLQEIRSLFDNGITLWHDSSSFLDYSQNNRS